MASHMGAKMAPSHPDFLLSLTLAEGALNKLYVVASETLLIGRLKVAYAPSEAWKLPLRPVCNPAQACIVQNEFTQYPAGAAERTTYSQQ